MKKQISLNDAVAGTARAMLNVCAFVCFFSALQQIILTCLKPIIPFEELSVMIASLTEISGAVKLCSMLQGGGKIMCSFAVGFGGLSAIMQSISLCSGLRLSKYLLSRLAVGTLCTLYYLLISYVAGKI